MFAYFLYFAIVNILNLFLEIIKAEYPYNGALTSKKVRKKLETSVAKAIECILATQIVANGELTIWCQQHDHKTYKPAKARSYELPSYCPQESASLVMFLMAQPNPDSRIKKAIHSAMRRVFPYILP